MGILKSISKSMKGTIIGDIAKSADKAIDTTNSFLGDCIEDTFNEVVDSANSIAKGAGKIAKGAGKMARSVSGYEAYESRKKAKEAKELADRMVANIEEENKRRREESNRILSDFGKTKLELLKTCISPFLNYIKIMGNDYKDKEYEIGGKIGLDKLDLEALETIEMNASTAGKMAIASSGAAAIALCGVPTATTWAVGTFAAASTGTAISPFWSCCYERNFGMARRRLFGSRWRRNGCRLCCAWHNNCYYNRSFCFGGSRSYCFCLLFKKIYGSHSLFGRNQKSQS